MFCRNDNGEVELRGADVTARHFQGAAFVDKIPHGGRESYVSRPPAAATLQSDHHLAKFVCRRDKKENTKTVL